jgi:hypothetical protein
MRAANTFVSDAGRLIDTSGFAWTAAEVAS